LPYRQFGAALSDARQVHEAAAKIAARHRLGDLLHSREALRNDALNQRVGSAAERALPALLSPSPDV
jgi:hypothetical protein